MINDSMNQIKPNYVCFIRTNAEEDVEDRIKIPAYNGLTTVQSEYMPGSLIIVPRECLGKTLLFGKSREVLGKLTQTLNRGKSTT